MRYLVKFNSGNELHITEEQYFHVVRGEVADGYINLDHVDYILPEDIIENGSSAVIIPPAPGEIKRKQHEEHEKKLSNPTALINDIKKKSIDHGEGDE